MTTTKSSASQEYQYIPLTDDAQYFSTYDLGCAAALISTEFELVSLDKENPRKVRFVFSRKVGIDAIVNDYFSNKLKLAARVLFDNIKMLKNRIYST